MKSRPQLSTQWTADTASSTTPNGTGGTYTFDYTLTLSDEDTKADEQARIDAETPLVDLSQVPWGEHYYGYRGKLALTASADTDRMDLENYNDIDTYGDVREDKAIVRFNVPTELQIPGVAYRARVIETYHPYDYRQPPQVIGIQDVTMHQGAWTSPEIAIQPPVGYGYTEVEHFAAVAEEVAPHQILALAGLASGATPSAPAEYAATKPTLVAQPQITDANGVTRLSRRVLTGSQTLQQINLADDGSALQGGSGASATWSLVAGSTGTVRLWRWHDDGSALGKWFVVTSQDNLVPYYNSATDFLFVEALSGGKSTVRITLTVAGQSVQDDIAIIAQGVQASLAVDANRDGTIELPPTDGSAYADQTTADKPFRFWLNDGVDGYCSAPGESSVQDSLDPSHNPANCIPGQQGTITCTRDLENLARLWLNVSGLQSILTASPNTYQIGLKWLAGSAGAPALNLYTSADASGSASYLDDPSGAAEQAQIAAPFGQVITDVNGKFTVDTNGTFIFKKDVWANLTQASPVAHFLFEGVGEGAGQLAVVILDANGKELCTGPSIYVDLKNIKELYERWTVGDGNGGTPETIAGISSDRLLPGIHGLQYSSGSPGLSVPGDPNQNAYILLVHGWNMPPWAKDAFAETALKRLYWQGYKGKFGAFEWPTTYTTATSEYFADAQEIANYDDGEFSAWQSGAPLARLLLSLHHAYGNLNLLAHSMGNVVAGEALRIAGQSGAGPLVSTYIASQAAVPGHCYDPTLTGNDLLDFSHINLGGHSIPGSYGPVTPNIYNNWMMPPNLVMSSKANFYNVNDYALNYWQADQVLKPDARFYAYDYLGSADDSPAQDQFGKNVLGTRLMLHLGDATNVQDRYEIMAYDAEPRSKALGAVPDAAGFTPQSLISAWMPDNLTSLHDYSEHAWHSAQFRFTNAEQQYYWQTILVEFGILPNPLPLKP